MTITVTEHAVDRFIERVAAVTRDQARTAILASSKAIEGGSRLRRVRRPARQWRQAGAERNRGRHRPAAPLDLPFPAEGSAEMLTQAQRIDSAIRAADLLAEAEIFSVASPEYIEHSREKLEEALEHLQDSLAKLAPKREAA